LLSELNELESKINNQNTNFIRLILSQKSELTQFQQTQHPQYQFNSEKNQTLFKKYFHQSLNYQIILIRKSIYYILLLEE